VTRRMPHRPAVDLIWLFSGPAIWFLGFSALYAAETIVCLIPRPMAMPGIASAIVLLTLGALALVARGIFRREPADETGAFVRAAASLLIGLSALATLWMGAPLLLLRACIAPAI
jgi:hypothetical protein